MSKHTIMLWILLASFALILTTAACGYTSTDSSSVADNGSGTSSGGSSGSGSSSLTPQIYFETHTVRQGDIVSVSLEGFTPGSSIHLAIYADDSSNRILAAVVEADQEGISYYEFPIDERFSVGDYVIYAQQDDGTVAEENFEVVRNSGGSDGSSPSDRSSREPLLGVEPESGPRGAEFLLIFEGFIPGEIIEFVIVDPDNREVYSDVVEINNEGTAIYSIISETSDVVGWYTVYAYGDVSSLEASFQITGSGAPSNPNPNPNPQPAANPFLSISPTSGGQTTQFDLTLSGFRPNEGVYVSVYSQESGEEEFVFEIEIDDSGQGSGWLRTGTDHPAGYYFIAAEGDQGSYADGEIYVEATSQTTQVSYDEALNIVAQAVHSYWVIEFQRRGWGLQKYDVPELEEYIAPASVCPGLAPENTHNNAFYCRKENKIAWDRALMYSEWEDYGAIGISVTIGHEYGHLIMDQTGNVPTYYVDKDGDGVRDLVEMQVQEELLADCSAGAFLNHAVSTGLFTYDEALGAVDLIYTFGGGGGSFVWHDPDFHGTPQFRAAMLAGGLDGGLDWCLHGSD